MHPPAPQEHVETLHKTQTVLICTPQPHLFIPIVVMPLIHERAGELCWWRGLVGFPPGHFAQDAPWEEKTSQNAGLGPILWFYYPGAEPSNGGRSGLLSIPGGLESV